MKLFAAVPIVVLISLSGCGKFSTPTQAEITQKYAEWGCRRSGEFITNPVEGGSPFVVYTCRDGNKYTGSELFDMILADKQK